MMSIHCITYVIEYVMSSSYQLSSKVLVQYKLGIKHDNI